MKSLLVFLAISLLGAAHALTLEEALRSAPARPDAVTARLELLNAGNDLVRVQGDPLALRMDVLQAEQRTELKRAELEQAHYQALQEIAGAYTGLLQAREQAVLAEAGLELSEISLEIARIRHANGSATELDVQEAEVAVADAGQGLEAVRGAMGIAEASLEGLIGREVDAAELEPVPDAFLVDLPLLDDALAAIAGHPTLVQSRQGLELARVGVELLDPSYASTSQIESARTQLATTEELVAEARRGFDLQARNALIQAENAGETYRLEQERLANARERLALQETRLASGLIPAVQYQRSEIETAQAELAAMSARHAFLDALLGLQAVTFVDLGGPAVLGFTLEERAGVAREE